MKKKLLFLGIISLIIITSIIINDNVKDKSKIINYNGNSLMVTIDDKTMESLPSSGNYYLTSYECDNPNTKVIWNRTTYKLDLSNGRSEGNVYCNLTFKSKPLLNEMPVGSYVAYTGVGGKVGSTSVLCKTNGSASSSTASAETESPNSCSGQNAREDLDTSNYTYGYCYRGNYRYYTTGWRIAYIKDNKVRLVSAGSPECNSREESTANVTYIKMANAKALKYCNSIYVDGDCTCTSSTDGQCDSASTDAWAINDTDFYYMTKAISGVGKRLTSGSSTLGDSGGTLGENLYCNGNYSRQECGYNNDLIDNGGFYWFAAQYKSSSAGGVVWYPTFRNVYDDYYNITGACGLRPVISLSSSVIVTGGSGTMDDPYTIKSGNVTLLSEVPVGSYVDYTGNNGCTGSSCSGVNANSAVCEFSSHNFNSSGWRVAYVDSEKVHLISAGAPECMCTDSAGNALTSCSDSGSFSLHYHNMNNIALKYCNSNYADGGTCTSNNNVWAMNELDFKKITGYAPNDSNCSGSGATSSCRNELSDVGSAYWVSAESSFTNSFYWWYPSYRSLVSITYYDIAYGIRPIIKLSPNVYITGGTGTETDPYTIDIG